MSGLQIFSNPEFGEIRMVEVDERPYAVGIDIANMLEYKEPHKAVSAHCRGGISYPVIDSLGRTQETKVIPEGDIYRLIIKAADQSKNPDIKARAEEIEKWIFDEVLPSIRKTGAYITNRADPEMLRKKADEIESMSALNEAAKIILPVLEEAGLKPQYRAIALKQIYRKGGMDLPIEEMKAERELFDLMAIAKTVGIYSITDNPHGQAVGVIIRKLDIEDDEKELITFEKNGHSGTAFQYTKSVIEKVRKWIEDNGYPYVIATVDSTGKEKKFKVSYQNPLKKEA